MKSVWTFHNKAFLEELDLWYHLNCEEIQIEAGLKNARAYKFMSRIAPNHSSPVFQFEVYDISYQVVYYLNEISQCNIISYCNNSASLDATLLLKLWLNDRLTRVTCLKTDLWGTWLLNPSLTWYYLKIRDIFGC